MRAYKSQKKSNKALSMLIIVLVVLFVCSFGVAGYYTFSNLSSDANEEVPNDNSNVIEDTPAEKEPSIEDPSDDTLTDVQPDDIVIPDEVLSSNLDVSSIDEIVGVEFLIEDYLKQDDYDKDYGTFTKTSCIVLNIDTVGKDFEIIEGKYNITFEIGYSGSTSKLIFEDVEVTSNGFDCFKPFYNSDGELIGSYWIALSRSITLSIDSDTVTSLDNAGYELAIAQGGSLISKFNTIKLINFEKLS